MASLDIFAMENDLDIISFSFNVFKAFLRTLISHRLVISLIIGVIILGRLVLQLGRVVMTRGAGLLGFHPEYYMEIAHFEVDKTKYRVHTDSLRANIPLLFTSFENFSNPHSRRKQLYIKLPPNLKDCFESLLRYLYPLNSATSTTLKAEDWISILDIATNLRAIDLRTRAISALQATPGACIYMFAAGCEFGVPDLLLAGLIGALKCQSHFHPNKIEFTVNIIGLEMVVRLCRLREEIYEQEVKWSVYLKTIKHKKGRRLGRLDQSHDQSSISASTVRRVLGSMASISDTEQENSHSCDLVERILFARQVHKSDWFEESCNALAHRARPLSLEEVESLGLPLAAKIWQARAELRKEVTMDLRTSSDPNAGIDCSSPQPDGPLEYILMVREAFDREIKKAEQMEQTNMNGTPQTSTELP